MAFSSLLSDLADAPLPAGLEARPHLLPNVSDHGPHFDVRKVFDEVRRVREGVENAPLQIREILGVLIRALGSAA